MLEWLEPGNCCCWPTHDVALQLHSRATLLCNRTAVWPARGQQYVHAQKHRATAAQAAAAPTTTCRMVLPLDELTGSVAMSTALRELPHQQPEIQQHLARGIAVVHRCDVSLHALSKHVAGLQV